MMIDFIRNNFMGAFIVVILSSGAMLSGEVVDGTNSIIALKTGGFTVYINGNAIEAFY